MLFVAMLICILIGAALYTSVGHGGATVVARGDGFMVDDWLQISAL